MRFLASFVMQGRMQAMLAAAACAVLSLILVPAAWLSGAVIALVTLRQGAREGLVVSAGAALGAGALITPIMGNPLPALGFALLLWLPVWLLAMVLRHTVSLAYSVQTATLLGLLMVLGVHLAVADPVVWWQHLLNTLVKPSILRAGYAKPAEIDRLLKLAAEFMTGTAAAFMVITLMLGLLTGRWWQAMLYNPGGLRQEFHDLRMGRTVTLATLAVLGLAVATQSTLIRDGAIVMMVMYVFQGLALIHGLVAKTGAHTVWLVGLYVLMAFALPQVLIVLAGVGLIDSGLDFRARVGGKGAG